MLLLNCFVINLTDSDLFRIHNTANSMTKSTFISTETVEDYMSMYRKTFLKLLVPYGNRYGTAGGRMIYVLTYQYDIDTNTQFYFS